MRKTQWMVLFFALICTLALSACGDTNQTLPQNDDHVHAFGEWTITKKANCTEDGVNERYCACGEKQTQSVVALGHTVVIDDAVAATCTTDGKTEGKHCSVCNEVLVAQTVVAKLDHTEVIDAAVAATCTTDGKTEGKHCLVCNETLIAQTVVGKLGHIEVIDDAVAVTCTTDGKTEGKHCSRCTLTLVEQTTIRYTGHQYNSGEITREATCIQSGIKTFTCNILTCGHSYTEDYILPTYTATEIYNQSVKYVGEIVIYDKTGAKIALGTGFVISSDGKIVTNYHVIEDAYFAEITINNTTYPIVEILAYEENIDLVVLKINATGLDYANICKNAVQTGEAVYAMGSSKGLTNTFSQGIITQAQRVVDGVLHIQHDAAISSGNSGGPLLNVYGEVIGINKMSRIDSQNINMAVFTTELDNLVYESPMTLAEFYELKHDAFNQLVDFILANGEYDPESNTTRLLLTEGYVSSDTQYVIVDFTYNANDNYVELSYFIEFVGSEGIVFTSIFLEKNVNDYFYGTYIYFDDTIRTDMSGYIDSQTFTENTLVGYKSYNGEASKKADTREIASITAICLIECLEWLATDYLGVTIADFGFVSFP